MQLYPPRYRPETNDPYGEFDNASLLERGEAIQSDIKDAIAAALPIREKYGRDFYSSGHLIDAVNFRTKVERLMPELKKYFKEVKTRMDPEVDLGIDDEEFVINRVQWTDQTPPVTEVMIIYQDLDRLNEQFTLSANKVNKRPDRTKINN